MYLVYVMLLYLSVCYVARGQQVDGRNPTTNTTLSTQTSSGSHSADGLLPSNISTSGSTLSSSSRPKNSSSSPTSPVIFTTKTLPSVKPDNQTNSGLPSQVASATSSTGASLPDKSGSSSIPRSTMAPDTQKVTTHRPADVFVANGTDNITPTTHSPFSSRVTTVTMGTNAPTQFVTPSRGKCFQFSKLNNI